MSENKKLKGDPLIEKGVRTELKKCATLLDVAVEWEHSFRDALDAPDKYRYPSGKKKCREKLTERKQEAYNNLVRIKNVVSIMIEQFNEATRTDEYLNPGGIDNIL